MESNGLHKDKQNVLIASNICGNESQWSTVLRAATQSWGDYVITLAICLWLSALERVIALTVLYLPGKCTLSPEQLERDGQSIREGSVVFWCTEVLGH